MSTQGEDSMIGKWALLVLCAVAAAGCTSNELLRTEHTAQPGVCDFDAASVPDACRKHSIEARKDYLLGIVEFDDQGWYRDRRQQEILFHELEQIGKEQDMIIITFVHGWKHNAGYCDSNMCCFRDMLKQVASLEEKYSQAYNRPKRRVVGVYVGWRGLSNKGLDLWENASFYTRKETATRVALGSTRELMTRLRDFQARVNKTPESSGKSAQAAADGKNTRGQTRLITVGHSFGGLIVYSAIAQSLVVNAIDDEADQGKNLVTGFGDLVVLVNPAIEASRYEPVYS